VKLILQTQLLPDGDQARKLSATMRAFNAAADWLAGEAFRLAAPAGVKAQRPLVAFIVLFAFFSPLFAKQSRQAEMIRLGQEFELKINQDATIEGEGLTVAFESVLEDGRCPEGLTCVWAGNAKIKIKLSKRPRTPGAVELNTGVKPKSSSFLDYEIKLVALNPRPKGDKPVETNEYKATLIVVKK
jgi:hypothetical protein